MAQRDSVLTTIVLILVCLSPEIQAQEPAVSKPELAFPRVAPTEPANVASGIRAQHEFRLELLAAEPLTMDPVAIDYDENGLAYVVEMSDYPYTDKASDKPFVERTRDLPIGRVRILEDLDGDGKFDRSTIFAEQLSWPTGLAFWKGGVFVAATPDIWYFKDTNGDRKADIRRKVFTGFRKFNVQAVMNNLKTGPDQWIYGAGSSNGGTITHVERKDQPPLVLGRHDFRFDPISERMELISGGARFGNTFDDYGERFLCNIRNPVQHVVLPSHYLARNPLLSVASAIHDAAQAGDTVPVFRISPVEPWRAVRAQRWVQESGQNYPRSETHADGYFTSSSGVTVYRGSAYPPEFYGNVFLGEVAANAIHRQVMQRDGVTFKAERADQKVEFVASTDNWFRPVNFVNAPDGTLHVLDMYRETIEHPWSIPDDIKAQVDLESGRDRGRIYRLTPPGFQLKSPPRLGAATTAEVVMALRHPDSWWRETAQRLLFERQDPTALPLLKELLRSANPSESEAKAAAKPAESSMSENETQRQAALARLHALWCLATLGQLQDEDLVVALQDASPRVREHAIRLAEPRLNTSPDLTKIVMKQVDAEDPRVLFQLAFSCGAATNKEAEEAVAQTLAKLTIKRGEDPWTRVAILSSSSRHAANLARKLYPASNPDHVVTTLRDLALFLAAPGDLSQVEHFCTELLEIEQRQAYAKTPMRLAVAQGLINGLKRGGKPVSARTSSDQTSLGKFLQLAIQLAEESLGDPKATLAQRLGAIPLQMLREPVVARDQLVKLLKVDEPPELQLAAVRQLSLLPLPEISQLLLDRYRSLSPTLQAEVVESLLSRPERIRLLLDSLEQRTVLTSQVSTARRVLLFKHADETIRARATALFAKDAPGPRQDVLKAYRAALTLSADPERGRVVLRRVCLACHRWKDEGQEVGPNLETIRNRTPDEVLLHVLDPNREVPPNLLEYVVLLKDGRTTTGIIAAETAGSITLRKPEGRQEVLLRQDIDEFYSSGRSLMPEGLEKSVTIQEMADLLMLLLGKT